MKILNGKKYYSKQEIIKTLHAICIDDVNDVASYCEWVLAYEGPADIIIEGINLGISLALDSVNATDEVSMNEKQLILLMRETLHHNVDFNVRTLMESDGDDLDINVMLCLENEGILICIDEIKELDHYYRVQT
jgi:hypothetical protein